MQHASPFCTFAGAAALVLQGWALAATLSAQETTVPDAGAEGKANLDRGVRVDATDEAALRENLGKKTIVSGLIKRTREWDGGANFLDFEGGKLTLVCFASEYAHFPDGRPAATLRNKHVEVTGYISAYKGKLQIKLTHPDQVRIIASKAAGAQPEDADGASKDGAQEPCPAAPERPPKKVDPGKYFCC